MPPPLRVGLVGSSGGGGATLGHGDAQSFIKCVRRELEVGSRGALELVVVQFVACAKPLDVADMATAAQLWVSERPGEDVRLAAEGTLGQVNVAARRVDQRTFGSGNSSISSFLLAASSSRVKVLTTAL